MWRWLVKLIVGRRWNQDDGLIVDSRLGAAILGGTEGVVGTNLFFWGWGLT